MIQKLDKKILVLLLISCSLNVYSGENNDNQKIILKLSDEIEQILIQEKICTSKQDCQKNQLYFISPSTNGIAIDTYSITDTKVLRLITDKCLDVFYSTNAVNIEIESFKYSKTEEL